MAISPAERDCSKAEKDNDQFIPLYQFQSTIDQPSHPSGVIDAVGWMPIAITQLIIMVDCFLKVS
jgi:hypothetical protein